MLRRTQAPPPHGTQAPPPRRPLPAACALAALTLLLATSTRAAADSAIPENGRADGLFWEGRRAVEAGDLDAACDRFARSLSLERTPGTLLNLAGCEERRGRFATAWRLYQEAQLRMGADDRRQTIAEERVLSLSSQLPRLSLRPPPTPPRGLRVTCDGEPIELATLSAPRPLDPGKHRVRVTAPGHAFRELEVDLAAAETLTLDLELGPRRPPPDRPAPPSFTSFLAAPLPPADPTATARATAGWILTGTGGLGLVLGLVGGGLVLREKAIFDTYCTAGGACREQTGVDAANRGIMWGTAANIASAAGGVLLVTGVVLVLTARASSPPAPVSPAAPAAKGSAPR